MTEQPLASSSSFNSASVSGLEVARLEAEATLNAENRRKAVRVVAGMSADLTDCRELLGMLGLDLTDVRAVVGAVPAAATKVKRSRSAA